MKKEFDFYEFTGIILPGMIVLLFLAVTHPTVNKWLSAEKLGLGEFGVLILLSYITGHLIQGFSNAWEWVFWKLQGGMPTDQLRNKKQTVISAAQLALVEAKVPIFLKTSIPEGVAGFPADAWKGLTRQMYAAVQAAGRNARIDTFNGNYGMMRGTVTAGLITGFFTIGMGIQPEVRILCWIACGTALACYRTRRYGLLYARELFAQFIQLDEPSAA